MKRVFCLFMLIVMVSSSINANEIIKKLDTRMKEARSLVCVGLDPDVVKMPLSITQSGKVIEDNVFDFLSQVVDITAEYACCYKVQKAFFDQYEQGHLLFQSIDSLSA